MRCDVMGWDGIGWDVAMILLASAVVMVTVVVVVLTCGRLPAAIDCLLILLPYGPS
jgi:hypothetical protein